MTFVVSSKMDWLYQRCHKESILHSLFRSGLLLLGLLMVLSLSMYPMLRSMGVQLHSVFTGSYVPGHHSVLLINSPNEQVAKDIGRAIMERRMAASVNILPRTMTMYYWKGEIQDATEILMVKKYLDFVFKVIKTRTSRVKEVTDFMRSVHPYENPEVLSFPVEDGSLAYMKWIDEAVPAD